MRIRRALGLTFAAALAALPLRAQSAQCTGNVAPNKTNTTALVETASDNDLATGYHFYTQAVTLTITAKAVVLCASVQTPPLDMGSVGTYPKPYSDLEVQVPPGSWTPLMSVDQLLYSGSGTSPMVVSANVRVRISNLDLPGTYGASIVFTPYKK